MAGKQRVAIIGAGGFGREVFYLLDDHFYECIGFIDFDKTGEDLSRPILGCEDDMACMIDEYEFSSCVLAIGDIRKRKGIH